MASHKDETSETGETEDIPSDFFDDFNKDEFMEGLSVIDECWDETSGAPGQRKSRIDAEALDSVKDLRQLISENNDDDYKQKPPKRYPRAIIDSKYKWRKPELQQESSLNNFIKPGSRRDPSKTNQAIKKDKEVKVQQFLAKSLESSDDLRPPGTELDDYYDEENKRIDPESTEEDLSFQDYNRPKKNHMQSPLRPQYSPRPRYSPRRRSPRTHYSPHFHHSPRPYVHREGPRHTFYNKNQFPPKQHKFFKKFSPVKMARRNYSPQRRSPGRHSPFRRSPVRHSPLRRSPMRHSPGRRSPVRHSPSRRSPIRHSPSRRSPIRHSPSRRSPIRHSPRRYSPSRRSPRRQLRSRSPYRRTSSRRSHSQSRSRSRCRSPRRDDNFLYPNNLDAPTRYPPENVPYQPEPVQQYTPPVHSEYGGSVPGYSYPQVPAYGSSFPGPYNYGVPQAPQTSMPGPVPMPNVNTTPATGILNPSQAPSMVPAPTQLIPEKATPYDALAQLVAEGKISQEDYLKLTPNKGQSSAMDTKTRVMVLTRCNQALSKLDKLLLPNRLMVTSETIGSDNKYLTPKYCSPLKRQAVTEFSFTKGSVSPAQQTKQLVESIISTLGLDKVVSKYKKKLPKDVKDAVVQTIKSQCDVCEIRESTKYHDVGTSTEPEYFTTTVHTQVVEQDLVSSKSIFNVSGGVGEGPSMSIAHLTPAQLVSQLAARAKTLKQPQDNPPPSNQFTRRPNYDYDDRGGQQYHHFYNNYHY